MQIKTPIGRIVSGSLSVSNSKKMDGTPLIHKDGSPREEYYIALAISKNNPEYAAFKAEFDNAVNTECAHMMQNGALPPHFAYKFKDGDSNVPGTSGGAAPCTLTGWPGNWVFNLTSGYAPKCFAKGGVSEIDAKMIERGYYVRCLIDVTCNNSPSKPGVYLNLRAVEFFGYGEVIQSAGAVSGSEFSDAPTYTPPGMLSEPTATVVQPPASQPMGMQPQQQPPASQPMGMQPAAAPMAQPQQQPAAQIPAPAGAQIPAPAPDILQPKKIDANGQVWTVQQLLDAGITQDQIAAMPNAQ